MTDYEAKLQQQRYLKLRHQSTRIITATGGAEAREFVVEPLMGERAGAFIRYRRYVDIYASIEGGPRLVCDEFASLTKNQARRLAHALLLWSEESEEEAADPVVLPLR